MFTDKDFQPVQQNSLWNSPQLHNITASLQAGPSGLGDLGLKIGQLDAVQEHFHQLAPPLESLAPTEAPYFNELKHHFSRGHGVQATTNDVSSSSQKRFLIFDQSGNQIRLFSSSFNCPFQNQVIVPEMPVCPWNLKDEKLKAGQTSLVKVIAQSKADENYTSSGGDKREDTEEINALLYSNSCSEDDDDVDSENDELTSTGQSPFATAGGCEEHENICELTEEVASTDCSTKRQKLLDGGYKKSSLVENATSSKMVRSINYNDDLESSCAKGRDLDEDTNSILRTGQRKAKICDTLRILRSILPGMKAKDPILIIDAAINYLKSLRQEATVLGVSQPELQSPLPQ